jgi:hypothetical protein
MRADFATLRARGPHDTDAAGIIVTRMTATQLPFVVLNSAGIGNELDPDLNAAIRIATPAGTLGYLLPGTSGATLLDWSGGGESETESALDKQGIITYTSAPDGKVVYFGMVPATNTSLLFAGPHGRRVHIAVTDGTFVVPAAEVRTFRVRSVSGILQTWRAGPPPASPDNGSVRSTDQLLY